MNLNSGTIVLPLKFFLFKSTISKPHNLLYRSCLFCYLWHWKACVTRNIFQQKYDRIAPTILLGSHRKIHGCHFLISKSEYFWWWKNCFSYVFDLWVQFWPILQDQKCLHLFQQYNKVSITLCLQFLSNLWVALILYEGKFLPYIS